MVEDSLLSLSEAALAAKMARERLLRRIQNGQVEGRLIAGRWFLERESLERLIEAGSHGPLPTA